MTLLQVGTADSYLGLVATAACCKHHKTKHKTKDGLFVCFRIISVKDIQELFMLLKRSGGGGNKSYFTAQISQLLV